MPHNRGGGGSRAVPSHVLRIDLDGELAEGPALLEIADRVDTLAGDLDVTPRRDGVHVVAAIPVG